MKSKKITLLTFLFLALIFLSSCAPKNYTSDEYGFFSGIWHGLIICFSVIGKMFNADIGIYAMKNTGFTYWLGYLIGLGALGGGASRAR